MSRRFSRARGPLRSSLSVVLTSAMLLIGFPGVAFAASPVAVPDGSPDVITSIYGDEAGGLLGYDIASDGDLVAIGIPGAASGGEVAIYRRTSAGLSFETTITGPDAGSFGYAVDVSGDALIVGAPEANGADGMAYFYRESGGMWSLETTVPGNAGQAARLGHDVAIDGTYAVIGLPHYGAGDGFILIMNDTGAGWSLDTNFAGPRGARAQFGTSVDVSVDGAVPVVVAGAYRYATSRGMAYSYRLLSGTWRVNTTSMYGPNIGSWFGRAVATDGTNVVVGAPLADVRATNAGAAYVYTTDGRLRRTLTPASAPANGQFGSTLDLDNGTLAAGSPSLDRVTIFTGSDTTWTEGTTFTPPSPLPSDSFPLGLAVQGSTLFAGSPGDDSLAPNGGAVHEYSSGWYSTTEETTLTVPAPGVLGNDFDTDGDPLESYLVTDTPNGSVTMNTDGSFQYVPDVDFDGYDSFMYRTYDGSTYSSPTVATIFVANVNDAPQFVQSSPTTVTCSEDENPTPFTLTLDVDDPDSGDVMNWGISAAPTHGTVAVSGAGLSKTINYNPNANYYGTDSFTVRVNDLARVYDYLTVDVIIDPINDAPTFSLRTPYNTAEDIGPITHANWVTGISPGGWNETGQALVANTTSTNPALFTVQPNISVTGTLTFEPAPNAYGSAIVSLGITDDNTAGAPGSLTTTKTMTINVAPVNDAPTALDDGYFVEEDEGLIIAAPGILMNDTDVEGPTDTPYWGPLTSHLESTATNGALFLFDNGSFIYSPDEGWSGQDTFTYRAFDGGLFSEITTVTIDVASVNDDPIIDQGGTIAATCPEDGSVDTTLTAIDYDDDFLTWTIAAQPADGTASAASADTTGVVTYTPDPDFNGNDSFTAMVSDGNGGTDLIVVEVTVTPDNDAPVAVDIEFWVDEDGLLVEPDPGFMANSYDLEMDSLVATGFALPTIGAMPMVSYTDGSFIYIPPTNYNGDATFNFQLTDGMAASNWATGTIHIEPANDAPTATVDAFSATEDISMISTGSVLANDTDIDGDALMAEIASQPANGTAVMMANGYFLYTGAQDFNGIDTFTYRAFDGADYSAPTTVTITVAPAEDDPVIDQGAVTHQVTAEDTTLTVALSATDPDGDALTWSIVDQADEGMAAAGGTGTTTTVTYMPDPDYNGDDAFSVAVTDTTGRTDIIAVDVEVTPVNDAPIASDLAYETAEDTTLTVTPPGLYNGFWDIDGDMPAASAVATTAATNGTLTDPGDGGFEFIPDSDFNGDAYITYEVSDGALWSNTATVTITVTPVNDAPSFTPGAAISVPEDSGPTTVTAWATDIYTGAYNETQTLAFEVTNDSESLFTAQPAISTSGTLLFESAPNANGTATVSATLIDDDTAGGAALESATATFTIEITPVNDVPEAYDDAYEVAEDTTLTVAPLGVLDNDFDVDGDSLTASVETSPTHGVLVLNADGSFDYRADADYNGTDIFTYRASDAATSSAPATVTITVTPVNDEPVAVGESYSLQEDTTYTKAAPGLLKNDSDIDGDELSAVLDTDVSRGTLTLNADGSFSYTPESGWSGTDSFTYTAFDGELHSAPVEVKLTVRSVDTRYTKVEGVNRFLTAIVASKKTFPSGADTVVIATAFNWPDALAGSGLAGAVDGPILLTNQDDVPATTLREIDRLGAKKAYVLGGTAAASPNVVAMLQAELGTSNVIRLGGADRYETSSLVAAEAIKKLGSSWGGTALLATGKDFPDAIAASPMSAGAGWPIFLVRSSGVTAANIADLNSSNVDHTVVLGGTSSIYYGSDKVLRDAGFTVERVSGSDRYSTSVAIAEFGAKHAGLSWDVVGIATGEEFPDALAGGVTCAKRGGVLILSPSDTSNGSVESALTKHRSEIDEVLFFGGTAALSQEVRDGVRNTLR